MNNSQNMESTIPPQPTFQDGINMPPDNHYVQNENHCQRLLNNKCCNFFLCIGRWVPVVIVSAILTWVYYAFVIELCLHIIESIVKKVIFLSIFHFLVIMLYWSYWATILAKNMAIPNQFYLPSEVTEALRVSGSNEVAKEIVAKYVLEQKLPIKNRMHDQAYRYCSHCTMVKPDRAHHCSICKTCNLKFDHHCPWINNCVMYSNYKQFLLFLGYGFTLCVFVAITNIDALVTFFNTTQNGSTSLSISKSFHLIFLEFISVMFGISISVILVFHIYLVLKNRTTLETYKSPTFDFGVDKMAYNRSYLQNLREVFGSSILLAFVPIFSAGGSGISFSTRYSPTSISKRQLISLDSLSESSQESEHSDCFSDYENEDAIAVSFNDLNISPRSNYPTTTNSGFKYSAIPQN